MSRRADLPRQASGIRVERPAEAEAKSRGLATETDDDPTAVIVVHGMGQQLPFQTLDAVVAGLCRADGKKKPGAAAGTTAVRIARVHEADLPRVELTLTRGDRPQRVHLYEAYWAPLTEGVVTLRDVLRFLWGAAWNGHRNARGGKGFHRYLFGGVVTSRPEAGGQLTVAALVLAALVALNAAAGGIFAAAVLKVIGPVWAETDLIAGITCIVALMLGAIAVFAFAMRATRRMVFFHLLIATLVGATAWIAVAFLARWLTGSSALLPDAPAWVSRPWVIGGFWTVLVAFSALVRKLLVQYVGDVAAYVTSHTLDRFYELRQRIKKAVRDVTDNVYKDTLPGGAPRYGRIAVVGHSLGSVAAYDALNAIINTDLTQHSGALHAVERTKLFLTFGSPLDKTAFIFTAQGHATGIVREALAAAAQPLIQDYRFRTFPWVNVYSKADIVSGALDLYDGPLGTYVEHAGRRVENVIDPKARTPLVAHTEYWTSDVVFERLHSALVARSPAAQPAMAS